MDPFTAVVIAAASVWALRRGTQKIADNSRRWWQRTRERAAHQVADRPWIAGSYKLARAGTRNALILGNGLGAGVADGWREGWQRAKDWRAAREAATAEHQRWLQVNPRQRLQVRAAERTDPMYHRGRFHGLRGHKQALDLNHSAAYCDGWRDGIATRRRDLARAPKPAPPAATPPDKDPPPQPAKAAAPTPEGGNSSMSEVVTVEQALAAARQFRKEALAEVEDASSAARNAQEEMEAAQATVRRAEQRVTALETLAAGLRQLGFGQALVTHVDEMQQAATAQRDAGQTLMEAVALAGRANQQWLTRAEHLLTAAQALDKALATHSTVQEVAAGAVGGMAHRQAYGAAGTTGGSA